LKNAKAGRESFHIVRIGGRKVSDWGTYQKPRGKKGVRGGEIRGGKESWSGLHEVIWEGRAFKD